MGDLTRGGGHRAVGTSHRLEIHEALDDRDRTVLRLVGDVDLQTAPLLRRRIESAGKRGTDLVIDLREVALMDSPGLGILVHSARLHRERGGHLVLKDPVGAVRELFEIAVLARIIEVE